MSALLRARELTYRSLGDTVVVCDARSDTGHTLPAQTAEILRRLDGNSSDADIATSLGLDVATVNAAIVSLAEAGLIEPAAGLSRRRLLAAAGAGAVAIPVISTIALPTAAAAVSLHGPPSPGTGPTAHEFNLSAEFNDVGVTTTSNQSAGNFDGGGYTYPAEGFTFTGGFSSNGYLFNPNFSGSGSPDNAQGGGTIPLPGAPAGASGLGILFSRANGNVGPTPFTVTYSDATTSTGSIDLEDWCLPSTAFTVQSTVGRHDHSGGIDGSHPPGLFVASAALTAGKTVVSVTLPTDSNLHVFAISTK